MIYDCLLFRQDDYLAVMFAMSRPKAIHLRAVTCRDEGFNLIIADEGHERRELILREQGLDLYVLLHAVSALYVV